MPGLSLAQAAPVRVSRDGRGRGRDSAWTACPRPRAQGSLSRSFHMPSFHWFIPGLVAPPQSRGRSWEAPGKPSSTAEAFSGKEELLQRGSAERLGKWATRGAAETDSPEEAFRERAQGFGGGQSLCPGRSPEPRWADSPAGRITGGPPPSPAGGAKVCVTSFPRCCPSLITPNEWPFVHERKAGCVCL